MAALPPGLFAFGDAAMRAAWVAGVNGGQAMKKTENDKPKPDEKPEAEKPVEPKPEGQKTGRGYRYD